MDQHDKNDKNDMVSLSSYSSTSFAFDEEDEQTQEEEEEEDEFLGENEGDDERHRSVSILGEIVSGYRLSRDDPTTTTSDAAHANANATPSIDDDLALRGAFCTIKFGTRTVHKTKCAKAGPNWRNPVWTLSTQSLFAFEATPRELAHTDLNVSVWYKRKDPLMITVLETCFLGQVVINGLRLLEQCNEQLYTLDLKDVDENSDDADERMMMMMDCAAIGSTNARGTLSVRFRLATPADEHLVRQLKAHPQLLQHPGSSQLFRLLQSPPPQSNGNDDSSESPRNVVKMLTEQDEARIAGVTFVQALSTVFVSKTQTDRESGQTRIRVKPHPDPEHPDETTWLLPHEFRATTLQNSHKWIEAGSGTLGKVYLEILSCHDLPNVDVGEAMGNLTDAFVCAVFEDAMVQTPVIDDELSPHWLPWTQRAFCFGLCHPASLLHVGVFDFDLGPRPHEPLGRVSIPIGQFQRDTAYTLKYNLHKSANVTDRTPSGAITVRLRVEFVDEKQAILTALRPRPKFHINVRREKSHAVVRYACFGEYGQDAEDTFDLTVARSYVNEIFEYKSALSYCFNDALRSLLFWEGQVRFCGLWLPVHSLLLFVWGTVLLERPHLFPSFILLSVAWTMLATQTSSRQHPSPWRRCPSFGHYVKTLYYGKSPLAMRQIGVNEGAAKAEAYEQQWRDRLEKDQKVAQARLALQEEIDLIGDESIHTKASNGGIPLDLLLRCARYQKLLARVCRFLRFIKIVVTWEESLLSFWITACFLSGGLASLLLPWKFILYWVSRLVVYGILGPHMKLVGLIVFRDEVKDDEMIQSIIERFRKMSQGARIRHQEAVKLKDVLCLSFGPYSTLTPAFNLNRHYDHPLPASFARLHHSKASSKLIFTSEFVPGQQCFGAMIPRCGLAARTFRDEMNRLQCVRDAILDLIKQIRDEEDHELIKRLQSLGSHEKDLPDSIGYELVSLLETNPPSDCDQPETNIALDEDCALHMCANSEVAILAERRRSIIQTSLRSSMRYGYELIAVNSTAAEGREEDCMRLGPTSTLLPNDDSRLAIVETSERRLSAVVRSKRLLSRRRRHQQRAKRTTRPHSKCGTAEEVEPTGGIEIVLLDQSMLPDGGTAASRDEVLGTESQCGVVFHCLVDHHRPNSD